MSPQRPQAADQALALAPGAGSLPPELLAPDPRGRLLAGALQAVTDHGYPATSVALILTASGVSRKTFYEHFANKEACVLATYDQIVGWLGERLTAALAGVQDWPLAVSLAVNDTLAAFVADPRLAQFCAVEILRLDRVGFARYQATVERLAVPLRRGRALCAWGADLPPVLEPTLVGGAIWLIGHRAAPEQLTGLARDITYFLLVPYLDTPAAQRAAAGVS